VFCDSQDDTLESISGKIKSYCPSIFQSLTSWEREALDSSGWLNRSTSSLLSSGVVDKAIEPLLPEVPSLNLSGRNKLPLVTLEATVVDLSPLRPFVTENHPGLSPVLIDQIHIKYVSSPLSLLPNTSEILPGCRDSYEHESSLSEVLDSLLPFLRDHQSIVPLLVYMGKVVYKVSNSGDFLVTTGPRIEESGKEFAWSRGLGIEHSPLKTRSSRKKLVGVESTSGDTGFSTNDSGALRVMKALARDK